jgi:hypothetical protein
MMVKKKFLLGGDVSCEVKQTNRKRKCSVFCSYFVVIKVTTFKD